MKAMQWSMAVVFVIFGALQINDPDPEYWASWYFCLALLCILDARNRISRFVWLLPVFIGCIWLWFIWPEQWQGFAFREGMHNVHVEQARESGGLIISILIAFLSFRFRSSKSK